MSTTPPEAPPQTGTGPRVSRDEARDLARLRRSASDRKVAGVAGGLARHLDIDPLIPRVLLVVLVFFGGAGLMLYAAAWLLVPVEGTDEATVRLDDRSRSAALVLVGVLAALALVGDSVGGWDFPWPLVVLGLVVLAVLGARGRDARPAPPRPAGGVGGGGGVGGVDKTGAHPWPAAPPAPPPPPPPPPPYRGPLLFPYALALIALGVGLLGLVDTAGAAVADSAYPALALGTCAVLLVLGAVWGRPGGLVALGLLAAIVTAAATVAGEVDAGDVRAAPTSAAAVADRYALDVGEIRLDLTDVADVEALDGRTVEVDVEVAGLVVVTVPDDLDVVVRSSVDIGDRQVLGRRLDSEDAVTAIDGGPDAPELTVVATVSVGAIEIDQETA